MTKELIHDRISFRKFLDIKDEDTIADETTICKFRNKLIKEELLGDIFEEVKKMMESKRLILNEETLIDATYTSKRGAKHYGLKMHIGHYH